MNQLLKKFRKRPIWLVVESQERKREWFRFYRTWVSFIENNSCVHTDFRPLQVPAILHPNCNIFCPLVYDGILLKQSRSRTFKWINIYYPNTFKPIKYQKNFKLQFYLQPHRQTTSNYHAHHGIGPNRQTAFRHFCNTRESCLSRKPYACSHLI